MTSKILVADDSVTIQKIVAMAFENEDAVVEGIGNGKEAFDHLQNFSPDVVLADVDMPGYNGFELSRMIKESSEFHSVAVLLLASDFEDFNEHLFKESRADDHISKPFKSDDIVQRVKELLSHEPAAGPAEEMEPDLMWDDEEDEEEVLALSEDDMVEAAPDEGFDFDTSDLIVEPVTFPTAEDPPDTPWPLSAENEEQGENQAKEENHPAPSFRNFGDSGDPLLALSLEEDDLDLDSQPSDAPSWPVKATAETGMHAANGADATGGPDAEDVEDEDFEGIELADDLFADEEDSEPDKKSFSPEAQAIDEAIDAVQALKKYSASVTEEGEWGSALGLDADAAADESVSFPEEDYDPTQGLELPTGFDAQGADAFSLDDPEFSIGLGFSPQDEDPEQAAGSSAGRREGTIPKVEASQGQDLHALDTALKQMRQSKAPAASMHGESSAEDWDLEEAIAPEPEDLLGDLVDASLIPEVKDVAPEIRNPPASPVSQPPTVTQSETAETAPARSEAPVQDALPDLEELAGNRNAETDTGSIAEEPERTLDELEEEEDAMEVPQRSPQAVPDSDRFTEALIAQIRPLLEQSLGASIDKEISGLSETIVQSVKEIVREVVPDIARSVIKEEIDRIKKMKDA